MHDVIIIGGGPAGLSAALVLGRCRRRVVLCDVGRGRNRWATGLHNYLTRDGIEPAEFVRIGRQEAETVGVEIRTARAVDAGRRAGGDGFWVELEEGAGGGSQSAAELSDGPAVRLESRMLLLATGVVDVLPGVPGFKELYGRSVHHCPYCDGWEHRDERIAAYGRGNGGKAALGLALSLRTWSDQVIACTDGEAVDAEGLARAARNGVQVRTEPVVALESVDGRLTAIRFASGRSEPCQALFFNTDQVVRSDLAERLGCRLRADGSVPTSRNQCTDVPGLYMAGDADRDVQFVIVAAAEGATAAVAINHELQKLERA